MSQPEGRSQSPSDDEEAGSYERATPLSAIAPDADGHYIQPTVMSSNPALQCLDQVDFCLCERIYLFNSYNRCTFFTNTDV